MQLDLLAFGAHPDDVELACSGTIAKQVSLNHTAGIIDLTKGELSTRGTVEEREKEAKEAASILKLSVRENLQFSDGFFQNDKEHQLEVIKMIRKYRPEVVLCNAFSDRHPDHGKASELVRDACFYSGLNKIETKDNGEFQKAWRPKAVYHYIQYYHIEPDFLVDISDFMEIKMASIKAYQSQFYNPDSKEPDTVISRKEFLDKIKSRDLINGSAIGTLYAEGFCKERPIGIKDLMSLL